jgi:hypothetical protein
MYSATSRPDQPFVRLAELSAWLGIPRAVLRGWSDDGVIPSVAAGTGRLYHFGDVEAAVRAMAQKPPADDNLLTASGVDRWLNWPRGRAKAMAEACELPAVVLPDGSIRFDRNEVAAKLSRDENDGAGGELLTLRETARDLGIPESDLADWCRRGTIAHYRTRGGGLYFGRRTLATAAAALLALKGKGGSTNG